MGTYSNACFNLVCYNDLDYNTILGIKGVKYGIIVKPLGATNLEGYLEFRSPKRISTLDRINDKAAWVRRKGDAIYTIEQYKIMGNYIEFGDEDYIEKIRETPMKIGNTEKEVQLYLYKFRIKRKSIDEMSLIEFLNKICKKWIFQLESTYEEVYNEYICANKCIDVFYYTGFLSLIKKKRKLTLFDEFLKIIPDYSNFTLYTQNLPTQINWNTQFESDDCYEFVNGPWTNIYNKIKSNKENSENIKMTTQSSSPLLNWQQNIFNTLKNTYVDERINIIITDGQKFNRINLDLKCKLEKIGVGINIKVSYVEIYEKILRFQNLNGYLINIPEFIGDEELKRIFASLEDIKQGIFEYKHLEMEVEPPHIWIYLYRLPDFNCLKDPKYVFWKIVDDKLVCFKF